MFIFIIILLLICIILDLYFMKKFCDKKFYDVKNLYLLPKKYRYILSFILLLLLYLMFIKNLHFSYALTYLILLNSLEYLIKTINLYKLNKESKCYYYTIYKCIILFIIGISSIIYIILNNINLK